MARKAQVKTFYNNYNETETMTIAEFLEKYPTVSRTSLNNRRGAETEPGVWWRNGAEPEIVKRNATQGEIEQMYVNISNLQKPDLPERRRETISNQMKSFSKQLEWRNAGWKTRRGVFYKLTYKGDNVYDVHRNDEYEMTFDIANAEVK